MKEIITSPQFWSTIIPVLAIIVSAFLAIWTFSKTKEAERESEWRKEKLKLYLKFVETLSGTTKADMTDEGAIQFAEACNNLHALAPASVLKALYEYQDQIRITNPDPSDELIQTTLDKLVYEIRKDLNIKPPDNENEFKMLLWTSGKKKTT